MRWQGGKRLECLFPCSAVPVQKYVLSSFFLPRYLAAHQGKGFSKQLFLPSVETSPLAGSSSHVPPTLQQRASSPDRLSGA